MLTLVMRKLEWLSVCSLVMLVGTGGCGRVGYEAGLEELADSGPVALDASAGPGVVQDAGPDAEEVPDAEVEPDAAPAVRCDWRLDPRFSDAVPIDEVNTPFNDLDSFLSADGLDLYFSVYEGPPKVHVATRASLDQPFGAPALVSFANSADGGDSLRLSDDERVAILASSRTPTSGLTDIWVAGRESTDAPWPAFERAEILASEHYDSDPVFVPAEQTLWFTRSAVDGGDPGKIMRSSFDPTALTFGPPSPVAELDTPNAEGNPTLTADGLTVVYTAVRGNAVDLYYATRDTVSDPFGPGQRIDALATAGLDWEAAVSRDGCELIFSRANSTTGQDLHRVLVSVP